MLAFVIPIMYSCLIKVHLASDHFVLQAANEQKCMNSSDKPQCSYVSHIFFIYTYNILTTCLCSFIETDRYWFRLESVNGSKHSRELIM